MLLTPDFVYIHQPKTGGTFVTATLSLLYSEGQGKASGQIVNLCKHGTCSDIPPEYRDKPIVATLRNPYERYVSQYRFGWWKLYPDAYCGLDEMRALYPHYPDLSFAEFVQMANTKFLNRYRGKATGYENRNFTTADGLGWHTEQFVRFFFRNPEQVFARIDEGYIEEEKYREDMFNVHFLRVDRLNWELYDWLLGLDHRRADLEFILTADRVLPAEGGRERGDRWQHYYTPQVKDFIRRRERFLFKLFPEFDA